MAAVDTRGIDINHRYQKLSCIMYTIVVVNNKQDDYPSSDKGTEGRMEGGR